MSTPERAVFDCNVFFQALINPAGPSGQCLVAAARGQVELFTSEWILAEVADVAARPKLRQRFAITDDRVHRLLEAVRDAAILVERINEVYTLRRDPDDSHYINLAIQTESRFVVSRDNDLLDLMSRSDRESAEFRRLFPSLEVVAPEDLLRRIDLA